MIIDIVPIISQEEMSQVARLLAETMSSNPNHLTIFKSQEPNAINKQEKMFSKALNMKHNEIHVTKVDGKIAGVMCYIGSDFCQLRPLQLLCMLPGLSITLGSILPRVLKWRFNWKTHDYKKPHIHFGPIAVANQYQGNGIGSALLETFCKSVDEKGQTAYLETDKEENVRLYEKFGFKVIENDTLFGVKNWFMVR